MYKKRCRHDGCDRHIYCAINSTHQNDTICSLYVSHDLKFLLLLNVYIMADRLLSSWWQAIFAELQAHGRSWPTRNLILSIYCVFAPLPIAWFLVQCGYNSSLQAVDVSAYGYHLQLCYPAHGQYLQLLHVHNMKLLSIPLIFSNCHWHPSLPWGILLLVVQDILIQHGKPHIHICNSCHFPTKFDGVFYFRNIISYTFQIYKNNLHNTYRLKKWGCF